MENLSGQVVKGYELCERIGAGGFGTVYQAYQSTVGREVAIKIILPHFANHPDFIRRFEGEAQVVARLEHLHIIPLYDYWRDPDGAYLVMRLLRGGNLRDALQEGPVGCGNSIHGCKRQQYAILNDTRSRLDPLSYLISKSVKRLRNARGGCSD